MRNSHRYIVTKFTKDDWQFWGISWLASLRQIYAGEILVVDEGLPAKAVAFLNLLSIKIINHLDSFVAENKGYYAYWDCYCYFQDSLDEIFDSDKLSCCRRSLSYGNGLTRLGFPPDVTTDPFTIANLLSSVINPSFFAGSSDVLLSYFGFLRSCLELEFLNHSDPALSLYALAFPQTINILDNSWDMPIGAHLHWGGDGLYTGKKKMKVIHIPPDMQYTADNASYHYQHRFPEIHDTWVSCYKGNPFNRNSLISL